MLQKCITIVFFRELQKYSDMQFMDKKAIAKDQGYFTQIIS